MAENHGCDEDYEITAIHWLKSVGDVAAGVHDEKEPSLYEQEVGEQKGVPLDAIVEEARMPSHEYASNYSEVSEKLSAGLGTELSARMVVAVFGIWMVLEVSPEFVDETAEAL
jgi:hypothetical protein